MKRNFTKLMNEGEALAKRTGSGLYASEMLQIREQAPGEWDIMERAYLAGLAAGYRLRKKEERQKAKKAAERSAKQEEKTRRALLQEVGQKLGYKPYEIETALEYAQEGGEA